jgi:hypothetical protein
MEKNDIGGIPCFDDLIRLSQEKKRLKAIKKHHSLT